VPNNVTGKEPGIINAMFKNVTLSKAIPYLLIVGGVIGLICSFIITEDKLKLAENPHFTPSCNLNPVISCGSVMSSKQGSLLGFPNPWIGLAAFAVLVTIGVSILAGSKFKRWFWVGLETGIVLGLAFAYWLLAESIYRIHALCPYCLAVDVVVITLFWYVSLYGVQEGFIKLPARLIGLGDFARKHHLDILLFWFVILIAVILQHFWYYYGQFLK
jgi:uncharacterized membrane protein